MKNETKIENMTKTQEIENKKDIGFETTIEF